MIIAKKDDILEARKIIDKINSGEVDIQVINRIISLISTIANSHTLYDQCTSTIRNKFTNVLQIDDDLFKVELESRNTDMVETFASFFKLVSEISPNSVRCTDYASSEEEDSDDEDDDDEDF